MENLLFRCVIPSSFRSVFSFLRDLNNCVVAGRIVSDVKSLIKQFVTTGYFLRNERECMFRFTRHKGRRAVRNPTGMSAAVVGR